MGLFMIPCGPRMDIRGWGEMNSFNGPNWSLTFEYVGNILYALIFRRLPKFALGLLCLCAAFLTNLFLRMFPVTVSVFSSTNQPLSGGLSGSAPAACALFLLCMAFLLTLQKFPVLRKRNSK